MNQVYLLEILGDYKLTPREIELDDGGAIEHLGDGELRRCDVHGNTEEVRRPEDKDWQEWAVLFGLKKIVIESQLFSCRENLTNWLAKWCRINWKQKGYNEPLSSNNEKAIDTYFDFNRPEEDWECTTKEIDPK